MALLKVKKTLRLDDLQDASVEAKVALSSASLRGTVYLEGEVVEPTDAEAKVLVEQFPEHFEDLTPKLKSGLQNLVDELKEKQKTEPSE